MNCKEFCEKYKGYKVSCVTPYYVGTEFEITGLYELGVRQSNDVIVLFDKNTGGNRRYYFDFINQDSVHNDKIKDICKLINTYRSAKRGGVG